MHSNAAWLAEEEKRDAKAAASRARHLFVEREAALELAAGGRFRFMDLPQELREMIMRLLLPEELETCVRSYDGKNESNDPTFVPALASMGNRQLRLESIDFTLQNVVLKVTNREESDNLRAWLANIDFGAMKQGSGNPLRTGFGSVRGLLISDGNRLRQRACYDGDESRFYHLSRFSFECIPQLFDPTSPGEDLELASALFLSALAPTCTEAL